MVSINIFGSNNSSLCDFNQDLNLNNNSICNLKDPELELDAANKRYVDSKLISSTTSVAYNENGEYIGNLLLEVDKEFGVIFGNNKNMISWRNRSTQLLKFTASAGFLFTTGRTRLMTISGTTGIKCFKDIDLGSSCRVINSLMPESDSDCATKSYCDAKLLKSGDTMLGNLLFDGSTRNIHLGCNNLGAENYFRMYLGNAASKINCYNGALDLYVGRILTLNIGSEMNVMVIDSGGITFTKQLSMNDRNITGLADPIEPRDAVNKDYVDRKFEELNARLERLESNFK